MPDNSNKHEEMQESCPHCSGKTKQRDVKEYKDLMNRLKRIEGQVRGVEGMLENDAYCTDILMQVSAITCALNSFNKALLANHMKTCVVDNIKEGNEEVIDELVTTLQKLMK
ncbi:DNA-binding transcriptional regulator, FrmR family [Butyrivibrio fibrisolvens DSM 3071]|uniref:DNA-binding transcriptional regulator, FrmR family n=1 Tax=Butyrivibrio fibrisolvens DSM 3071 TaxID=1121131 RepID=A0A1M6CM98_BUTFI|nr:metal-sensing transcriptional repressor [Butyrivibrio fibrisolvens]SHI62137.1 DNA-binding transcriptional regulator, FrmR family [Butyrivibrio fibrisolvens DSM 3071]